jgi:hypothetical protein
MKQHTGDGLGGVVGIVVWILIGAVSAFVIPSEIGKMYAKTVSRLRSAAGPACGSSRAGS